MPDTEMKDFTAIYGIFRSWSGLMSFICLGLASSGFRNALIGKARNQAHLMAILKYLEDDEKAKGIFNDFDEEAFENVSSRSISDSYDSLDEDEDKVPDLPKDSDSDDDGDADESSTSSDEN